MSLATEEVSNATGSTRVVGARAREAQPKNVLRIYWTSLSVMRVNALQRFPSRSYPRAAHADEVRK